MEGTRENYLEYLDEEYEELTVLNDNNGYRTVLVKEKNGSKLLIKKEISLAQAGVYQQLRSISHPNLAEVFDVCYSQKGCTVLEDYVSGRKLQEILEEKGKLSCSETMYYLEQMLEALATIHSYHIIHRDLKPENILISTDGVVKLLDFGIARFQKENQSKDTMILGTVGYASPEQFGFQQTDVRTDIYAVGILLNKMLTGKMPDEEVVKDEKIRKIIARCIEIDPRNRFESVECLKRELWKRKNIFVKSSESRISEAYGGISMGKYVGQLESEQEDITWIPGFRTGIRWKKILACMGYAFFLMGNIIYISDVMAGGFIAVALEMIAMLMYMWLPVAIAGNLFRWDRKVPVIRSLPRELRIVLRVVLCFLVIYVGLSLDSYVKYTIVGLPKPN